MKCYCSINTFLTSYKLFIYCTIKKTQIMIKKKHKKQNKTIHTIYKCNKVKSKSKPIVQPCKAATTIKRSKLILDPIFMGEYYYLKKQSQIIFSMVYYTKH